MTELENTEIEPISEESEDSYSNDDIYNITSWGADLSFRELITMYDEEELIKPELQRHYIWDKVEASRFVESLLLGLPVPSIFLANTSEDQKLIVDGYQRIMTVYDFVKGIWSKDGRVFKLFNSDKLNKRWRGKSFGELSSAEQRKIRSTTIHAIIFDQKKSEASDTSLYQIFERINTGGRALGAQEIRNCVYQGNLNSLLIEMNKDESWRHFVGKDVDSRMRDIEFILRFLALNTEKIKNVPKGNNSLKKLLNEYMGCKTNNTDDAINIQRAAFTSTIEFIKDNIGNSAFYNIVEGEPGKIRKRFYPTIFDALMVATAIALEKLGAGIPTDNLEAKRLDVLQNESFRKYISEGTMQTESIHGRVSLLLEGLYGIQYI
ncbi:DUF262 domain-containing protein [Shewanella surugensis]|uniref:DUF262 domain-containing protein n=1 Tax=Shewanella surugensis TaxID=212020 RepID=A0ABT0L6Y4_9GAMM|nr:DUF262 domain-containing protein [Shewanella surugensis]MCL1123324.1 DUF262 domain-containing protein [Shewanella surugensis]